MSEQEYTTAVIVAVPATDDPVHEFVTEDAHVTLHFMGEAADLPVGAADQMLADLAVLSAALYPFPANISGTATLGQDQANVLLVESEPLTKIREILGNTEPVAAACASVKQFPNWIPHLTLAYPEDSAAESVTSAPVDTVTIGGLSLWLGGDKHDFPFAKAAPGPVEEDIVVASALTAALGGDGKFDPSLHPRGADGQFIEKFGIVKFLTGGSWAYGKVTGISKDAHDQVKIEVTPSDLSGKTAGAPKDLLSKQLYKAPKAKAHLTVTAIGAKKIGGQGGSNPGGLYEIPKPGVVADNQGQIASEKFYVKKPKSKSHGQNEALANDLYAEAGVPVPEVDLHADGQLYSKIVDGQQDMAAQLKNPEWAAQIQKNFAVDAWLGNRDVFGMTYDNVLTDANGTPWRIDNGGALLYRAMGEKKTDFGGKVTELDAFRQGKKSAIYGPSMSKADELDGAQRVLAISPARIEEMVSEAGLPKSLADTLKARRAYIADYYGLPLPESQKPDGAQEGTSAPLVDAPDLAANKGKARHWFKVKLSQASFLLNAGDTVEFGDGSQQTFGVDGAYFQPLSIVGAQAQLMGWQQTHGADAEIMFAKKKKNTLPRPDHGSVLSGADLTWQNWQRGDKIELLGGDTYKILGANPTTGAVLVQAEGKNPWLLDTHGVNKAQMFTVQRWDPPTKPEPIAEPEAAPVVQAPTKDYSWIGEEAAHSKAQAQKVAPAPDDDLASYTMSSETGKYEEAATNTAPASTPSGYPFPPVTVLPPQEKTGQSAQAEAAIKADLITPLPTGNGPAAPKPDTAPAATGKGMLIGDGTEAQPGAQLVSKKDGKTYEFLKKKGQYAVVTDPNDLENPDKQLLKLASTLTQPGATPKADPTAIEKPKTATGEVPALGMMAVSKDGHAGEITLISPDGKFVFITDANGTRKRKSTGTVSITSVPVTAVDTPKKAPGPVKEYGAAPTKPWSGEEKVSGWEPTGQPAAYEMVHVGYADGSTGLEPYTGQPLEALQKNASGSVPVYGYVDGYMGPIAASQLVKAEQAATVKTTYQVIFSGNVFFTDGTTGPSGGLVLWYASDHDADVPGDDAWEVNPGSEQILNIIATEDAAATTLVLPEPGLGFQTADETVLPASPAPLYGDEAKTLAQWKGDLSVGSEISLDGENWMEITAVNPSGSVKAMSGNGQEVFINPWSSATYVVKAPAMKDGDAAETTFIPQAEVEQMFGTPAPTTKPAHELVSGDVVVIGGLITVISGMSSSPGATLLKTYGGQSDQEVHPDWEPEFLGNASQGPVDMPIHTAFPLIQSGHTIDVSETKQLTAVSFPQQTGDGSWFFAAIETGKPETPFMVNSSDFGPNVTMPVHLGPWKSHTELGVDTTAVDAAFEQATTVDTAPIDHNWAMAQAGIPFGTAQYPIFFSGEDNLYYRQGPTGLEKWDTGKVPSAWTTVEGGSTAGMDKVWDGKPFEGKLNIPSSLPQEEFLAGSFGYKPNPGELVVGVLVDDSTHTTGIVVYPSGSKDGKPFWATEGGTKADIPVGSPSVLAALENAPVLHDPFAEATDGPALTHHEGPQPPAALGVFMQQFNHTPVPGTQYFYAGKQGGAQRAFVKQEDGTWRRLLTTGSIGETIWTNDDLFGPDGFTKEYGYDSFTYTYVPEGTEAPKPVQGLPDGYAPFVPGEGQAVLKVTLTSGNTHVYLQQQPGASWYLMASDGTVHESASAAKSDWAVQNILNNGGTTETSTYELLNGTAADTPSFSGYTPQAGDVVFEETNKSHWVKTAADGKYHAVEDDGTLAQSFTMTQTEWDLASTGTPSTQVWPAEAAPAAAPAADAPSFNGYTPQDGDKVISFNPDGADKSYYVAQNGSTDYKPIKQDGTINPLGGVAEYQLSGYDGIEKEWPVDTADSGPSPVLFGYQTKPGDSVVQMVGQSGFSVVYVKPAGESKWKALDGDTGQFTGSEFDQDTIEFGATVDGVTTNVLLGELKGTPAAPQPLTEDKYAGVKAATTLYVNQVNFPGYNPKPDVLEKIGDLGMLMPGQSLYVIDNSAKGAGYSDTVWVRDSYQQWYQVTASGTLAPDVVLNSDAAWEQYIQSAGVQVQKMQLGAPTSAPVIKVPYTGPAISGWQDQGIPDPASFSFISDPSQGKGAKAGSWIYMAGPSGIGLFIQLKEDWDGSTQFKAGKVYTVQDGGKINPKAIDFTAEGGSPWNFVDANTHYISGDPVAGTPTSTGPGAAPAAAPSFKGFTPQAGDKVIKTTGGFFYAQIAGSDDWKQISSSTGVPDGAPVNAHVMKAQLDGASATQVWPVADAPSAPVEAPAPAPVAPSYPGATAPSQEDINAWGGALTKDGFIPSSGMYVTGKGPMSGKIVSVSKDKTKAVVLTSDGKKTTRLIEALKTDKTANYQAYAAPVTLKDIPGGMPLAVDTPAEVLAKTVKDGKFRAIVTNHPGVSGGSITVTKATGPSGKAYNRVHLALTNDQRAQLLALLSGAGEKGDWANNSKMSDQVAIGDQLPMRKSSQDNPDGSPRWKVDPSITPPTHEVTAVEDDPAGGGIKIVTLKNKTTGEVITSRFHPGKSLTVYSWDPNKPKAMQPGAFSLNETAKAQGWQHVTDGGISSATGGAADAKLHNEPGMTVTKSVFHDKSPNWKTLRNVSEDGVVIEVIDPKGSNSWSTTGTTVISIPEGLDEKSLGAAFAKLGIDYSPMTQDGAKTAARGLLRNLLSLDTNDVDSSKGWTDEKLFSQAGQTIGLSDLGWQDVLVGVDESTGKASYFWSDRARNALASKTKYNLVYRSATTADANAIVSTVKYGSANSVLKRTTGMIDATTGKGTGASWYEDLTNKAGHGSYVSASSMNTLPTGNSQAGYKGVGMMIYHRPEAVLGRIMDYRTAQGDAFGKGQGNGADHLAHATKSSGIKDFFMGGGLPTEAVGFIAVSSASARQQAIQKLKADGYDQINGRPIEEIVILLTDAQKLKPSDLPPVTIPANARPILDLPVSYDAPTSEVAA